MNWIQHGVPLVSVVLEYAVSLGLFLFSLSLLRTYRSRPSPISYYATAAFTSFALASFFTGSGKLISYLVSPQAFGLPVLEYSRVIGYLFICVSNIFFVRVLSSLFLSEDTQYPLFLVLFNSVAIGLLLPLILSPDAEGDVVVVASLVLLLTGMIHGMFAYFSFREMRMNELKLPRRGFRFIGLFSILGVSSLLFFVLDAVAREIYSLSFSAVYYLGWVMMLAATAFAYLGYLMPKWVR